MKTHFINFSIVNLVLHCSLMDFDYISVIGYWKPRSLLNDVSQSFSLSPAVLGLIHHSTNTGWASFMGQALDGALVLLLERV